MQHDIGTERLPPCTRAYTTLRAIEQKTLRKRRSTLSRRMVDLWTLKQFSRCTSCDTQCACHDVSQRPCFVCVSRSYNCATPFRPPPHALPSAIRRTRARQSTAVATCRKRQACALHHTHSPTYAVSNPLYHRVESYKRT